MSILASLSLTVWSGCGAALTCREPDVSSFTAEGIAYALCEVNFSRCEDGSQVTVSCDNDTFSGDYDCTWVFLDSTLTDVRTGSFSSPDYCVVAPDEMAAQLANAGGPGIVIE